MFSGCYSSRKFVELCHGLLLLFDGPTPAPDKVLELSRFIHPDSNVKLTDYVSGIVSFSPAEMVSLKLKIEAEIDSQFPVNASKKQHNKRPLAKQLSIMRYVVLSMFVKFTGNKPSTSNMCPGPKPDSELRKTLTDPMVVALDGKEVAPTGPEVGAVNPRTAQKEPRNKIPRRKPPPSIQVLRPTVLDELATEAPTNFDGQTLAMTFVKDPTLARTHDSYYQDLDKRFDPVHCRIATANEVAPLAPRVYVEGDPHGTNLHCGPTEMCLLRDLKHLHHSFKCDDQGLLPSIGKCSASLEVPMAISYATDDIAILRPGHSVFSKSFLKESLHVILPLCVKFVIEHGSSNQARDGDGSEWGTRIDFGCAGSGHEEIADGVWRPYRLCGEDVFNGVPEEERVQIKACFASVYDCIQVASDKTQKFNGRQPLFNYKPRDEVHGAALQDFFGAKVIKNEWCTVQVKCLSRRDQTASTTRLVLSALSFVIPSETSGRSSSCPTAVTLSVLTLIGCLA
jgi:hypothetical protein